MSDPIRKSQTFWQWLTHQPGDVVFPPQPIPPRPARTALDAIEDELSRIHSEMEDIRTDEYASENEAYHKLVDSLDKLNEELIRRSKEESSNETLPSR